jgi:hypothetical protein
MRHQAIKRGRAVPGFGMGDHHNRGMIEETILSPVHCLTGDHHFGKRIV